MRLIAKISLRTLLCGKVFFTFLGISMAVPLSDQSSLLKAQQIIEVIKKDETNHSFTSMLNDKVMKQHTFGSHDKGKPYFYTDNRTILSDIISMVLERPDSVVDEISATGILKIYRQFNFPRDIRPLLIKEKRPENGSLSSYLGETPTGSTNQVMVILKVEGNENNVKTLDTLLAFPSQIMTFVNAYPVKLK